EALTRLVGSKRRTHTVTEQEARTIARQAADLWRAQITSVSYEGDAHYFIDMLTFSYAQNGWPGGGQKELKRLVDNLSADIYPSRACFARFRLAQEYAASKKYDAAITVLQEGLALFIDRPFPAFHDDLCAKLYFLLAFCQRERGDTAAAGQTIDAV